MSNTGGIKRTYSRGVRTGNWVDLEAESLPPLTDDGKTKNFQSTAKTTFANHSYEMANCIQPPVIREGLDSHLLFGHGLNEDDWKRGAFETTYRAHIATTAQNLETDRSRPYFGKTNLLDQLNRSADGRLEGNRSPDRYLESTGVGTKKARSISKHLDSPLNQIPFRKPMEYKLTPLKTNK